MKKFKRRKRKWITYSRYLTKWLNIVERSKNKRIIKKNYKKIFSVMRND